MAGGATNSDLEARVVEEINANEAEMLALLERLVNIDSPSRDKKAVDAVGAALKAFLESEGIGVETIPHESAGDVLRASVPASGGANTPPIILMGHRDTVFPLGEAARRPFRSDGKRAYGPGVGDMKGGLVINAFILRALKRHGGAARQVTMLATSDEEIGSPASRPVIEREAAAASAVFNSEPGRPNGNVVTGRKGGLFMRLDVKGRAAHSGAVPGTGISAVHAVAAKIGELAALADPLRGISVNVGVLQGGELINIVAPSAHAEFDLRYVARADGEEMLSRIREIVATEHVAGAKGELTVMSEFLPMEQSPGSRALFERYAESAADAGLAVAGDFAGGCADSGFTSGVGTPTVCGTGPIGGGYHTVDEYIEIASMVPRARALALAVIRTALD